MRTVDLDTEVDSRGTKFPRVVQPHDAEGKARGDAVAVASLVTDYLTDLSQERAHALRALLVEVVPGDGMSTLVDEVQEAAESVDHTLVVVLRGNSGEELPELSEAVGTRRLRAAAREAGLLGRGGAGRLTTGVMVLAAVVLAVLGLLVSAWVKNATPVTNDAGAFLDPSLLLVALVAVALPLVVKRLWDRIDQRLVTSETLAERIREASTDQLGAMVGRLVGGFADATRPRCVVVDDYATLDGCTKQFVREYLRRFGLADHRPELWVVAENSLSHDRGALWVEVQAAGRKPNRDGLVRTRLHRLEHLTPEQRRHLADEVGHPERARFPTVRAITARSMLSYDSVFDEAAVRDRQSRSYTQLDLIHVLAVTATCGGNLRWTEATLVRALESKRGLRSAVLHCLLPKGSLDRSELVPRLTQLRTAFVPVIQPEAPGQPASLLVDYEAASALEATWRERKLSAPGLVHLFWSLHWYEARRRRPEDAFYVDKLARHLTTASLPGEYANLAGQVAGIHQTLFEALDSTIHACLRTGQLDHVPGLVLQAGSLLKADETPGAEARRRRLLRLAWDVHGLVGDDRVLLTIDEVAALSEGDDSVERTHELPSGGFFEDPFHERSVLKRTQSSLSLPDLQPLRVVGDYGFFQDSWMALSLAPLLPDAAVAAREAVADRRVSVAARLEALVAERQDVASGWPALEQVTMSLGLWCWSLSSRAEGLAELLTSAYLLADDVRAARDTVESAKAADLVRDGLAEELQIAVATTGLMGLAEGLQHDRLDDEVEDVTRTQLVDLGLWKDTPLRDLVAVSAASRAVSRRMTLLEVTWRSLGFSYLAAMLGLRRVQLEAAMATSSEEEKSASQPGSWRGLAEELDRPGRRGVLAGIVVAGVERSDGPRVAAHLVRVATLSLASTMRDDLVSQFSLVALSHSHSYGTVDKRALVGHLAAPGPSGRSRMYELLRSTADDLVDNVASWFLNGLGLPADEHTSTAILTAVRDRVAMMEPGSPHRDEVESELDVFEIRRDIASGVDIDVDALIHHWAGHRERSAYPFVLYLLLDRDRLDHRDLLREIAAVARDYPLYIASSGILLLSHRVVELGWPPEHHDLVTPAHLVWMLEYLFPIWDGKLAPSVSQDILTTLIEHDDGQRRELYLRRRRHWHEVELELAETTRLPRWLTEGKYAVVLESYWRLLFDYGIVGTDPASAAQPPEVAQQVPAPLVAPHGKPMVNVEFIREVRSAFDAQAQDDAFADRRRELDELARQSLVRFFRVLADAEDVPDSLKAILSRHADLVQRRLALGDSEHFETV